MEQKLHRLGPTQSKNLLILMPGAGNRHTSFEEHGFMQSAAEVNFTADLLTVDINYDHFADLSIEKRLHEEVVLPAQVQGYERIWIGGISLGGFASIIYARKHSKLLSGLVLFAPYLGNKGTLAEIAFAGGLDAWNPNITDDHDERHVWKLIKNYPNFGADALNNLPLYLLYGEDDRFVKFHQLLSTKLKPEVVTTISGGHDWPVWQALWQHFILEGPLSFSSTKKGFQS